MKEDKQIALAIESTSTNPIREKRIKLQAMIDSKLDILVANLNRLTYSDLVWASRVEDFYIQYQYLTERQVQVLNSVVSRYSDQTLS